MKKAVIILLVAVLIAAAVIGIVAFSGLGFSTGRCLIAGDSVMLIVDNSPIVLHPRKGAEMFDGLCTGDEILVLHDGILESYPARTGACWVTKVAVGTIEDIPAELIETLREMGWLS